MDSNLCVVVGEGCFRFPDVAQATAARDWAVYNSIRFGEFRARYPAIPWENFAPGGAAESGKVKILPK